MTTVNVTTANNSVTVTDNGATTVVKTPVTTVVKATFPVPYFNVNDSAKVDKSIVYYDAASGQFKADDTQTTSTLTDGGNF